MITLSQIIEFLKSEGTNYELVKAVDDITDKPFVFASTKRTVAYGCYYLTKEYLLFSSEIENSIILTNAKKTEINPGSNVFLLIEKPQLLHYKLAASISEKPKRGVHPTAIICPDATLSSSAYIGPYCVIENCIIKNNVQLLNNVIVRNNTTICENTIIEGNSVIGARGMAWIWDENGNRVLQPQLGGVHIGKNCIIGTDITIVRGSLTENTIVGDGTIIAHGTKIGHGSQISNNVHMANNVSLAGNAKIGERTFLGSACVVSSNVSIPPNCIVGAGAVVNKSITDSYATLVGVPAKVIKTNNFKEKPKGAPIPFKNIK